MNLQYFSYHVCCSINLEVARGKLVAVVGSVGSGKSSLLYSLLGEMNVRSGTVTMQVHRRLSVCLLCISIGLLVL
jgi:ABC-type branched-subunit amino acid transport system ATPase component